MSMARHKRRVLVLVPSALKCSLGNHEVQIADNLLMAAKALASHRPHLIVIDLAVAWQVTFVRHLSDQGRPAVVAVCSEAVRPLVDIADEWMSPDTETPEAEL